MSFTPDQEELRRYVRQWLDDRAPLEAVRRIMETGEGFDRSQWAELAELGWTGMAVAEERGGSGFGFRELAVVGEEMGRSLYPSPFLSSVVLGATLLETLDDDPQLLADVAAGRQRVAVAAGRAAAHTVTASGDGDNRVLEGTARFVIDGHTADVIVVQAKTEEGPAIFAVAGEHLARRRSSELDLTRPLARVEFERSPGRLLAAGPVVDSVLARMEARAAAFLAAEQVGGAQACLDMSVEYAKQRHQFGRPIGSFQAIKHMCADMLVAVESARSAAHHAAWALDEDPAEAELAVPLAKSYCSEAYFRAAADTIQIHGGIGFTWEHNAHLYFKRAKATQLMLGDPGHHRRRLAASLGLE